MERCSGFRSGMSSDVLTAMLSGLRCSSLPTGMSLGEEIRRWEPPRGLRISVVLFAGDGGPSRGPKYHECGRGLQILSRSGDEVLGFELVQATPQCGAVISKGEQTPGGYDTGSLGSLQEEFREITGTGDSRLPSFN
jgi:hypothetical protein